MKETKQKQVSNLSDGCLQLEIGNTFYLRHTHRVFIYYSY